MRFNKSGVLSWPSLVTPFPIGLFPWARTGLSPIGQFHTVFLGLLVWPDTNLFLGGPAFSFIRGVEYSISRTEDNKFGLLCTECYK
jgi:hypothetical protein